MLPRSSHLLLAAVALSSLAATVPHDGPDPLCHWLCTKSRLRDGALRARLGPDATVQGAPEVLADDYGESIQLDGKADAFVVAKGAVKGYREHLPTGC